MSYVHISIRHVKILHTYIAFITLLLYYDQQDWNFTFCVTISMQFTTVTCDFFFWGGGVSWLAGSIVSMLRVVHVLKNTYQTSGAMQRYRRGREEMMTPADSVTTPPWLTEAQLGLNSNNDCDPKQPNPLISNQSPFWKFPVWRRGWGGKNSRSIVGVLMVLWYIVVYQPVSKMRMWPSIVFWLIFK